MKLGRMDSWAASAAAPAEEMKDRRETTGSVYRKNFQLTGDAIVRHKSKHEEKRVNKITKSGNGDVFAAAFIALLGAVSSHVPAWPAPGYVLAKFAPCPEMFLRWI